LNISSLLENVYVSVICCAVEDIVDVRKAWLAAKEFATNPFETCRMNSDETIGDFMIY